jgi:hypothetical protein
MGGAADARCDRGARARRRPRRDRRDGHETIEWWHRGGVFEVTRIKWATLMDGRTQQDLEYDSPRIVRHLPVVEMRRSVA